MKRAFTQNTGSVPSQASDIEAPSTLLWKDKSQSSSPELTRRVGTSATKIGLAIAMAASGMLLSQKHQKVMAAEEFGLAKATEVSPNLDAQPEKKAPEAISAATPEASTPLAETTKLEAGKGVSLTEIQVPASEIQQPTPAIVAADGSTSVLKTPADKEEKPQLSSDIAQSDRSFADSSAANSVKQPVEAIPQPPTEASATATPKVIYQVKSGDTLEDIAKNYDTSVAKLAKLNSLDVEAPLVANQGLVVPDPNLSAASDASVADKSKSQAEVSIDKSMPSDSLAEEMNTNDLQAEMEKIKEGAQVRTLVAQATPESISISVPEPDTVAKASPMPQSLPTSPAKPQLEMAATGAIEIPVPQPENLSISPAKVQIRTSTVKARHIQTQTQAPAPVPIRQADTLQLEAGAIEIPVPKPATNFIPNRSQTGRLATAPLGTDDPNLGINSSPSREDLKQQFLNPSTNVSYAWPVSGVITSGFGMRWGRLHAGIDFGVPVGTPVYAAAPGIVKRSGWVGGYGNLVEILHPDGSVTRYGHNSQLMLQVGQEVRQGDLISLSGNTGRSTGPHVHFEIRPDGKQAVNPMSLLPRRA